MDEQTEWMQSIFRGAIAYEKQDYKLAEQMLRDALDQHKKVQPANSDRALSVVLENLSLIFIKQGRFARAERVLKRAISKDTSPHSACRLKYKLAQLYLLQGRYLLAETITGEASALAELCPVRDINMESEQLLRLANLWHHWGADQIALQHYKKVQEIRRSTLFSANAHSTMQREQGQSQEQLQDHLQRQLQEHLQEEEEEEEERNEEKQSLD